MECGNCFKVECGRCGWTGRRAGNWAAQRACPKCKASWMTHTLYSVFHRKACPQG